MALARTDVWTAPPGERLTAVVPAHNRVQQCIALVRFLRANGFSHPIVVADSSRPDRGNAIREAVEGLARYHSFDPQTRQYEKFARIARLVETPYIVQLPDDDIAFPHAIEAALADLERHADHVAAHGYSLRFGVDRGDFDIYQVEHFIPTIADADPMVRYLNLMRRYQPHIWAVFRREAYATAMEAAAPMPGTTFQEFMFQIVSVLLGKVARLPMIYAMRGMEEAQVAYSEVDPFQWLIKDADSLFKSYAVFRRSLINFLRTGEVKPQSAWQRLLGRAPAENGIGVENPRDLPLEQIVDLINATYLGQVSDTGTVVYAAQYALGMVERPVKFPGPWSGWRAPQPDDLVRSSQRGDRRYVWRQAVLKAEPKAEIQIGGDEMARVEAQLEHYDIDGPRVGRGEPVTWLVS